VKKIANLFSIAAIFLMMIQGLAQERRVPFGFGPPMASAELAKQPQTKGAKGDQQRHYFFEDANQEMPYHLYVPLNYDPGKETPLVVALHGYSGNHDYFFAVVDNLKELCEKHGFIFVAPMGYSIGGAYGAPLRRALPTVPQNIQTRNSDAERTEAQAKPKRIMPQKSEEEQLRERALSEKDVLNVIELVQDEYNIDPTRTYLMGHSMGGMGTYFLGQKYAENWAAIAPMSGTMGGVDYHLDRLKDTPIIIAVGETETRTADAAKEQLKEMHRLGMDAAYLEIPEGTHISMIKPSMPQIFKFFDRHRKPK
jgi:poly(3-hydroxybutyrate) depolymerase